MNHYKCRSFTILVLKFIYETESYLELLFQADICPITRKAHAFVDKNMITFSAATPKTK